jgi:hypothetical protein
MTMTSQRSAFPRFFLLAITLGLGFGIAWSILTFWIGETIQKAEQAENQSPTENLIVTAKNSIFVQEYQHRERGTSQETIRDMSGLVVKDADLTDRVQPTTLAGEPWWRESSSSRLDWARRIKSFTNDLAPDASWYFVHDGEQEGAGYFVGYQDPGSRLIGYLGLSGLRPGPPPASEQIPVLGKLMDLSSWSSVPVWYVPSGNNWVPHPERQDVPPRFVHVPSGNRLRVADLDARTVTTVFETPDSIVAIGIPILRSYVLGHTTVERPILVRTRQKIYALNHKHQPIREIRIPDEIDPRSSASWYDLENGDSILVFDLAGTAEEGFRRVRTYRIDSNGTMRELFKRSLKNGLISSGGAMSDAITAIALPGPGPFLGLGSLREQTVRSAQQIGTPGYLEAVVLTLKKSWAAVLVVSLVSSILAWFAWRRCRAFGFSRGQQYGWALIVWLTGLPGFVGFLLSRRWPPREPCPNCHERAPRDRDACSECGAPFPAPALKGIEILA